MTDPTPPGGPPPTTPYVGLVPFREEDADFFFGRSTEVRIVTGNLRASRLTIVYGTSGVGKTSLLQAGVVRALRRSVLERPKGRSERAPFSICVFRDWRGEPLVALLDAIRNSVVEAAGIDTVRLWQPGEPPLDALQAWTSDVRTLLVVLDQFEDYFLYHGDEDGPGTFAGELPAIVNEPNLRVNFLLSLREDALAKLDRFKGRIPRLFANYLRVEHLNRAAAREAIEGPVREWNRRLPPDEERYTLEPALVEAVIDAATGYEFAPAQREAQAAPEPASREDVEAPFLQLVMERVWRATVAAGSRELTISRLEQLGGARRIFEDHVLEALDTLTPRDRGIAADVFRFLVTPSKAKIARPASDLAQWTGHSEPDVTVVLDRLCTGESGRILRRIPPPAGTSAAPSYELYHDVLAEPIGEWRRDFEQERARRAALRRLVRVGGTLFVLVAIFASLFAWALVKRSEAQNATRAATSLALASAAGRELKARPEVSLLLALEAYRSSPSADATSAMVDALAVARRSGAERIWHNGNGVRTMAVSPDGRLLATGGFDGSIRFWDLEADTPLGEPLRAHPGEVWGVAFSRDGRTLASGGLDGTLLLLDAETQTAIGDLPVSETGGVAAVAFSPTDADTLAVGEDSGRVQLWDVGARRPIGDPLEGHTGRVDALAFSPDGRTLASGSWNEAIRLWDVRTQKPLGEIRGAHPGGVLGLEFSPNGRLLASSGSDEAVRIWDVRSRKQFGSALETQAGEIWDVAFSPDGRTLATPGYDGAVRLWDVASHREIGDPFLGHADDRVVSVAFGRKGRELLSSGYDGTVRAWSLPAPELLGAPLEGHEDQVKSVAFSPTDPSVLASADFGGSLIVWDVGRRKIATRPENSTDSLEVVVFSPDGRTLTTAGNDGVISLRSVQSGALIAQLKGHEGAIYGLAFSPDGRTLASGGADRTVRLWDMDGRETPGRVLEGHEESVSAVAFSPDGRTLASAGGLDNTLRLWDARSGDPDGQLPLGERDAVTSLAFSPDGRTLASGDSGGPVRLWDMRTREPVGAPLGEHAQRVGSLAYSPDGRWLASASDDGTVRLWTVRGHQPAGAPLRAHEGGAFSVSFSLGGRVLATGGADNEVRLWEGILWNDVDDLRAMVCSLVVGNLTESEWRALAPGLSYRTTCPG
jgi:WD40 repeat protein